MVFPIAVGGRCRVRDKDATLPSQTRNEDDFGYETLELEKRGPRMSVFRSLRELNESAPERISDHSPIIVDLPLQEPSLTTSLLRH
jgi:hypothetical protein